MLSPRLGNEEEENQRLLPEERELLEITGWTEEEYHWFVSQHRGAAVELAESGEPTALDPFTLILIQVIVGFALSYLGSVLFAPQQRSKSARVESTTVEGQSIVNNAKYAPSSGFDSLQNVVELGSIVPVVFTKRETIDGITYGGVRVNTNLLWSQLYSLGDSQLYKALLMVGVKGIGTPEPAQIAIGDNVLASYDLNPAGTTASRAAVYYQNEGRRITSSDFIAGRTPSTDIGNSQNAGGTDVFQIRGVNGAWTDSFCYASAPSNQTVFGLYSPIGNELGIKVNPRVESAYKAQTQIRGKKQDKSYLVCKKDPQSMLRRAKQEYPFSCRSGFVHINFVGGGGFATTSGSVHTVTKDQECIFYMSREADDLSTWTFDNGIQTSTLTGADVAESIAGKQRAWDEALVPGGVYKCGTAILVLTGRTPGNVPFVSRMDVSPASGGQSIFYTFKVIEQGVMCFSDYSKINRNIVDGLSVVGSGTDDCTLVNSPVSYKNGTNGSHLYRLAVATFTMARASQVVEIGYKTTANLRYNGVCSFSTTETYAYADANGCLTYDGTYLSGKGADTSRVIVTSQYQSGTVQIPEIRYVASRLSFRVLGTETWTVFPHILLFRGAGAAESRDYLRVQLPTNDIYEFKQLPIDGWEIRNGYATGMLCLLDASQTTLQTVYGAGATVEFNGSFLSFSQSTFALPSLQSNKYVGVGDVEIGDNGAYCYADAWGRIANIFTYEEISVSNDAPECRVAYVNNIITNPTTPTYSGLSTLALTLRSSTEFQSAQQISAYINEGVGNTHLIGSVLRILATDPEFGLGDQISPTAITPSFDEMDVWTYNRRYFFDGAVSEPFNLRVKGSELANYFLLDLLAKGSRFYLQPIAEQGVVYVPMAMYSAGNVFEFDYAQYEPEVRTPPVVNVLWRQERPDTSISSRGIFPVTRQVTVREAGTPESAPIISIDVSKWCTSEIQAIAIGKMECRKRRLITSGVKLTTRPDKAAFEPGRIVKVSLRTVTFNNPRSGIILSDGTVVCIPADLSGGPLPSGTYPMIVWSGTAVTLERKDVVVVDGKALSEFGSVFMLGEETPTSQTFKITKVGFNVDGDVEAEATEYPLAEDGTSLLVAGWDVAANWVIQGRVTSNESVVITQPFASAQILGNITSPLNGFSDYTALVNGPSGSYSYLWSGSGMTIANPTQNSTRITFTSAGTKTINLSVTSNGVTRTATRTVNVAGLSGFESMGDVTITGAATAVAGQTKSYTATVSGALAPVSWTWDISPDTDATITSSGASASVTYSSEGPFVLRAEAINPSAILSPVLAVKSIDVSPVDTIEDITISGAEGPGAGISSTYTATQSGGSSGTVWAWSAFPANATITGTGASVAVAFPTPSTAYTLTATGTNPNATDSPQTQTKVVTPVPVLGAVTVSGASAPTRAVATTYSATLSGTASVTSWSWSVTPAGATITGSGSSRSISFPTAGTTYTVTATATNTSAPDSPVSGVRTVIPV